MALTFGGAASDRVDVGAGSSINNVTVGTILFWVYPTSFTSRRLFQKGTGSMARFGVFNDIGAFTSGNGGFAYYRNRASVFVSAAAPLSTATLNEWQVLGMQWNEAGADADQKVFRGTLTTPLADVTAVQAVGSGAITADDATANLILGNRSAADSAFLGRIGIGAFFNQALSLGEMIDWQFRQRVPDGCIGYWIFNTGGIPDLSGNGNNGTLTGTSLVDHVPLGSPFGLDVGTRPVSAAADTTLAAGVTAAATVSVSLSTEITLQASVQATVTVSASLDTGSEMEASLSCTATASASLSTEIRLASSVSAVATVAADLDEGPARLAASILVSATAVLTLPGGIDSFDLSQITARSGVLRSATGRSCCVGDTAEVYSVDGALHHAGEFKYTQNLVAPEDFTTTYTQVAR